MTVIIKPPIAGLGMRDLLLAIDSMRRPGDPPVATGGGGFVVGEHLAHRFLAALLDVTPPPLPRVDVTTWDPTVPPHPPPAAPAPAPEVTPTPEPTDTPLPAAPARRTAKARTRRASR